MLPTAPGKFIRAISATSIAARRSGEKNGRHASPKKNVRWAIKKAIVTRFLRG